MEIGEYILSKIEQKNLTKSFVYSTLGMTEAGFRGMLKNNSISVKKFVEISEIISIDPSEYFLSINQNNSMVEGNEVKEDMTVYEKSKKTVNEPLTSSNTQQRGITTQMDELIRQNSQLIEIIDRLTK
jgi:hypothetical protein